MHPLAVMVSISYKHEGSVTRVGYCLQAVGLVKYRVNLMLRNTNMLVCLQVIAAPASSSHKQLQVTSVRTSVFDKQPKLFQLQRSSNLCGLCSFNNAAGQIIVNPAEMDAAADRIWMSAIENMGLHAEIPVTRFRDGKLDVSPFYCITATTYNCISMML